VPLRQTTVVEWPTALAPLLQEAQIASGSDGTRVCRIDVDVDAGTLLAIHEFEAHLRRRPVQLRLAGSAECMTGEMNPSFSLGAPSDRIRHIAKVRLSFHDLQDGECVDVADSY
jgi:hypothetical protein